MSDDDFLCQPCSTRFNLVCPVRPRRNDAETEQGVEGWEICEMVQWRRLKALKLRLRVLTMNLMWNLENVYDEHEDCQNNFHRQLLNEHDTT